MRIEQQSNGSDVTVHISLRGHPPGTDQRDGGAPDPSQVKEGVRKGLQSIKNHLEGGGGKEEPSVAT